MNQSDRMTLLFLVIFAAGACNDSSDNGNVEAENDKDAGIGRDTSGDAESFLNSDTDTNNGNESLWDTDGDTNSDFLSDSEPGLQPDGGMTSYKGFEDVYILTNSDDPEDVCRVRYDLSAVGKPKVACDICEWDIVLEKSNPQVVVDLNRACANSDLAIDEAALENAVGERVAYGFAREYVGHASILMRYNDATGNWEALTTANWDPVESVLRYNRRDGLCSYSGTGDTEPSFSGICGISGEAIVSN